MIVVRKHVAALRASGRAGLAAHPHARCRAFWGGIAAYRGRASEAGARLGGHWELVLTGWIGHTEKEEAVEPVVKKKAEGEWSDEEEEEEEDESEKITKLR